MGSQLDCETQLACIDVKTAEGRVNVGGELLDGFADVRGEELIDEHQFGHVEVQVEVVVEGWWGLSAVARSDDRPRSGGAVGA